MKAIVIDKQNDTYAAKYSDIDEAQLPEGDVTVTVEYSTLNYKDSLALTGFSPVVRTFPMVGGIDLAGTVEASSNPAYAVGDKVVLNGWGLSQTHWGGYAQKARVPGGWLVPLPSVFSTKQAMGIGTAGYTSMLCVMALEKHGVTPDKGEILVTGAAGGVGSVAIAILAKLGYTVVASTGRPAQADYLKALGAADTIDRNELSAPGRPMGSERWAGVVDAVGSHTLANAIASTKYDGAVAACGLAQGIDLPATVMPFIIRGVTLCGIDSVQAPKERRIEAWNRLATDLDIKYIEAMMSEVGLKDVIALSKDQMQGKTRGRIVVDVNR